MLSRRAFCGCATIAAATFAARPVHAENAACAVYTSTTQQSVSPDEAIKKLLAGNERFVGGKTINCDLIKQVKATSQGQAPFAAIVGCNLMAQVRATESGQYPFAAIVGCIDSRVPPELVFDQRIGDIFCARIAGNFVNTDIIGSLEFATRVAGARAIIVLGHSECGAVKGAIDDVRLGNLTATLANIRPAVAATKLDGDRTAKNPAMVQAVADTNARMAAAMLTSKSDILKELVNAGKLRIVPAMHDVSTGRVHLLS